MLVFECTPKQLVYFWSKLLRWVFLKKVNFFCKKYCKFILFWNPLWPTSSPKNAYLIGTHLKLNTKIREKTAQNVNKHLKKINLRKNKMQRPPFVIGCPYCTVHCTVGQLDLFFSFDMLSMDCLVRFFTSSDKKPCQHWGAYCRLWTLRNWLLTGIGENIFRTNSVKFGYPRKRRFFVVVSPHIFAIS